jgi:anti-anti-sigma factor
MTTTIDRPFQASLPWMEPPLRIKVSRGRRLALVIASGELDLATAPLLAETVGQLASTNRYRRIVVDVSAVTFVDLHGLRTLDRLTAGGVGRPAAVEVVPCAALMRLRRVLHGPGLWALADRPVA